MTSPALKRVRETARSRQLSAQAWEAAIVAAVPRHSFAEIARVAGVTRQRVWQIYQNHVPGRGAMADATTIKARLEELRAAIQAENISYGEIAELQGLSDHIEAGDVELLEWAGVSEEDAIDQGRI